MISIPQFHFSVPKLQDELNPPKVGKHHTNSANICGKAEAMCGLKRLHNALNEKVKQLVGHFASCILYQALGSLTEPTRS